ncbi:formyltransferase family protein [Paenibacillus sp. KN14-4R]|uniref:formyltransferase family protein n=1 Tax=Paenibacillus sp. KN14-4R TaxID=3445773 RepID=UPI003FA072DD
MRILYLGPSRKHIIDHMKSYGDEVVHWEDKLDQLFNGNFERSFDLIVSYGYRHIIKPHVLINYDKRIINLHISLLPWNKGADPNLWSFLDDTPKGVTIHYINEGIDTGEIILQQEVNFEPSDTLSTSYERLSTTIESLLMSNWKSIRTNNLPSTTQKHQGSIHFQKDKEQVRHLLHKGWDTPVKELIGKGNSVT